MSQFAILVPRSSYIFDSDLIGATGHQALGVQLNNCRFKPCVAPNDQRAGRRCDKQSIFTNEQFGCVCASKLAFDTDRVTSGFAAHGSHDLQKALLIVTIFERLPS